MRVSNLCDFAILEGLSNICDFIYVFWMSASFIFTLDEAVEC